MQQKKKMIEWFLTEIDDKTIMFDHLLISFDIIIKSSKISNFNYNKTIFFTKYCNWVYNNTNF